MLLHAQVDTGSLTGVVADSSGARVAGALVTLTNANTGVAVNVPSTSTGIYFFGGVVAGTYSLQVTQKGFRTFKANGIQIHVQQTDNLDVHLQVGVQNENVTVTTSAALLQTEDATLGQTVTGEAVDDLPLDGRDWTSLAMISAGVTTIWQGNASNQQFVVNGIIFSQNDYRLNGIDNNQEVYSANPSIVPPPDAIQEFKLQSGDFSAEFGHSTGGIVNATIKSGGNQVHGDLFEYVENNDFNANDYFSKQAGLPIAGYHQNQFGGTVGGPVFIPKLYNGRKKTFFFFDYQGTRLHTASTSFSTVPTALQASSGFTNLSDLITYS
ncbi:MAG: carboxypeptidase regulatory-like domain-containing protein, partial [Candidatus Sulfotelmatobacter sp.]